MRKVIVTGANGFIGSSLIRKLVENKVEVVALDISFANSYLPQSDHVTTIEMDLSNIEQRQREIPVAVYDAFYHLAWIGVNGCTKADPMTQVKNIEMALKCAIVAHNIGCKKFLSAGTIAEQAMRSLQNLEKVNSGMVYGVAKHCTRLLLETYCKSVGLKFIWMQFSNIYGPTNKTGNLVSYTINELSKEREATFGPALQPYDFVYIDDLLEAVYRLAKEEVSKSFYFIGSGSPRLLKDYLLEIGKLYGKEKLIKIGIRPDDGIRYNWEMFDITAIKGDIGEYTTVSFAEGIKYTIENY